MHKDFYASGFLYFPTSQQILLHQPNHEKNTSPSLWHMIGGRSNKDEDAHKAFIRIVHELLKIKLNPKLVYPVYDYFHETLHTTNHVFYAEVEDVSKIRVPGVSNLSWFTFKQTVKLSFTQQTKQDIIVAQRVINAQARSNEALLENSSTA